MYATTEVRWFFEGMPPPAAVEWFRGGNREPEVETRRVDHYFRLAGVNTLGIKLREGRIELKQRQRQLGVVRFAERVHGVMEQWHKWSMSLAESGTSLAAMVLPGRSWIGVEKRRQVRSYNVTDGNEVRVVEAGEFPRRGCSWELAAIRVAGQSWWTTGLEAFGDEGDTPGDLLRVAQLLLSDRVPQTLEAKDSFSYPEWLEIAGTRAVEP
jgi:hypothetical protein